MRFVTIGEPQPYPHRRMHRVRAEHTARLEAQPVVARADFFPIGHGELVVTGFGGNGGAPGGLGAAGGTGGAGGFPGGTKGGNGGQGSNG